MEKVGGRKKIPLHSKAKGDYIIIKKCINYELRDFPVLIVSENDITNTSSNQADAYRLSVGIEYA